MKAPTQSDIHPLAPPWIRRVSVLCLLACLPLTGCGDKTPAGKDDDAESSQDEPEDSEENSEEGSDDPEESQPEESEPEESEPEESEPEGSEDNESEEPDDDDDDNDDDEPESSDDGDDDDDDDDNDSDTGEGEPDPEGEPEKPKRDCEKISWGSATLAAGQVIARGDVTGYVDSNGDDKPETSDAPAGMCELHLTDKRCGLIVFGQGRSSG